MKVKTRIVLAKNHKVGGDTVKNVINSFGYRKNLTFLLPKPFKNSMAYPHGMTSQNLMALPKGKPDIWVYHTIFNSQKFRSMFPNDTVYITILREPFSQLKSVWNYYKLSSKFNISEDGPAGIATFLDSPEKYDMKCDHGSRYPFCFTRNPMAVDLGFPMQENMKILQTQQQKQKISKDFVRQIEGQFSLVMIMEHFDESLVLLKREMCWTLKDILYYVANNRNYSWRHVEIPTTQKKQHKQWSSVDYALYNYFNKTLWNKIERSENDFNGELRFFRHVNAKMKEHCDQLLRGEACSVYGSVLKISESRWSPGFDIDLEDCELIKRTSQCHFALQAERAIRVLGKQQDIDPSNWRKGRENVDLPFLQLSPPDGCTNFLNILRGIRQASRRKETEERKAHSSKRVLEPKPLSK
ncbi:PREDICTED: galactose-3-O-sulfotransferase 3-like [Branchiostoma belcheri]|uniref:Galactose-3-O-sulfotransferase 3-like n=1 Tax=Branchiostoma belcheri TaxID=7741 RepID=A0A6P4ZLV8_BRABE|nr:PREDICTED: galactose-3-O-sulfotransferase 3-like [Branchiostoma belcheri]